MGIDRRQQRSCLSFGLGYCCCDFAELLSSWSPDRRPYFWFKFNALLFVTSAALLVDIVYVVTDHEMTAMTASEEKKLAVVLERSWAQHTYLVWSFVTTFVWFFEVTSLSVNDFLTQRRVRDGDGDDSNSDAKIDDGNFGSGNDDDEDPEKKRRRELMYHYLARIIEWFVVVWLLLDSLHALDQWMVSRGNVDGDEFEVDFVDVLISTVCYFFAAIGNFQLLHSLHHGDPPHDDEGDVFNDVERGGVGKGKRHQNEHGPNENTALLSSTLFEEGVVSTSTSDLDIPYGDGPS